MLKLYTRLFAARVETIRMLRLSRTGRINIASSKKKWKLFKTAAARADIVECVSRAMVYT